MNALFRKPRLKRSNQRVKLIEDRALDSRKRLDARELLDEPVQVAFELDRAVPGLKGKGRRPHMPECGRKEFRREPVGDRGRTQFHLARGHQFEQFHPVGHRETHRGHVDDGAVAVDQARLRMRLDLLVESNRLVEHGLARIDQGRDRFEQSPGAFEIVRRQHASAAQGVAILVIAAAIEASAQHRQGFVNRDVAARQAAIPDHESSRSEGTDAAAHEVCFSVSDGHGIFLSKGMIGWI